MKNVQNYTGLPTVTDGSLKESVWLTSLHQDIVEGTIEFDTKTLPETIPVTVNGNSYNPEVLPMLIASFERCYGAKSRITVEEAIKLASAGFVTPQQQTIFLKGIKESKEKDDTFATSKVVISASEYLHNCVKLGLSGDNLGTIQDLALQVHHLTDKATKAELWELLQHFVAVFVSFDQYSTYKVKLSDEEAAKVKFERLTQAGFTGINTMTAGRYVGVLEASNLGAIATLQPDFVLVGTNSADGRVYTVTFKDADIEQV